MSQFSLTDRAWAAKAVRDEPQRRAEADHAVVVAYSRIEAAVAADDLAGAFAEYQTWRVSRELVNQERDRLVRALGIVGDDLGVTRLGPRPWGDGDLVATFDQTLHVLVASRVRLARKVGEVALNTEVEQAARGEPDD